MTSIKKVNIFILLILTILIIVSCNSNSSADMKDNTAASDMNIQATIIATTAHTIKPTITISPTPSPEPTPIPYVNLSDSTSLLSVREGPGTNTAKLGMLNNGDSVTILEQGDVWHKIDYNGQDGYVFAAYIKDVAIHYAYVPKLSATIDGKTYISNMVDIRTILPDIKIWLTFASQDNVMGKVLYPAGACLLQEITAQKLAKASAIFKEDGYRIRLFDGYRPYSVSVYLYEKIKDGRFVANPSKNPSTHNRGAAIDITLERIDTGNQIEMPSKMHTFNISSLRKFPDITVYTKGSADYDAFLEKYPDIFDYGTRSSAAIKNMNYMTNVMKECGFTTISTEWWHFNDKDKMQFMVLDYDLEKDVEWIPQDEYEAFMAEKKDEEPITDLPDYVVFPVIDD